MFGKIFDTMYTGSMVGAGSTVFALMPYAVTHCNADGFVELNPKLIGAIFGEPVEKVEEAIEYLCAPDPDSRSEDEEGRRLVKEGAFLYRLVNHAKYRHLQNAEAQRAKTRERVRKHREKKREEEAKQECNAPVTQSNDNTETETETENTNYIVKNSPPKAIEAVCKANFEKARRLYPGKKRGLDVEWENFKRKHKDWRDLLDDEGLKECVEILIQRKAYSPGFWPMFQTFCNQSRYEEALQ